ncbi:MAG: alanyl-tRNA editing protein [Acidimicrobiales bacterium]
MTEPLYLRDAYLREFHAVVVEVRDRVVALDRTAFYPTGGGQPHDTGTVAVAASDAGGPLAGAARVTDVTKEGAVVWHHVDGQFGVGDHVLGALDWVRRHQLMRTHTALHILNGVVWNRWGALATGNNMEPLAARIDYEFDPLPAGFGEELEQLIDVEVRAARRIEVSFLPGDAARADPALIRTKVNLIPASVAEVRVVDIVGLDRQADGGTHVRTTDEVGRVRVVKTESKGRSNKRVRIEIHDR